MEIKNITVMSYSNYRSSVLDLVSVKYISEIFDGQFAKNYELEVNIKGNLEKIEW